MSDEDKGTLREFRETVNMTPARLEKWLSSEESSAVGQKAKGAESVGHHSGRRVVQLLRKRQGDYTADDIRHMRKVIGYIHRHLAQRPRGDITETRWRFSLMNWGHDPKH